LIANQVNCNAQDLVNEEIVIVGLGRPAQLVAVDPQCSELRLGARVLLWELDGRFLDPNGAAALRTLHDRSCPLARPRIRSKLIEQLA
jgi:hypothetical protein